MMTAKFIISSVIAYFLGNISPSTIIGKMMGVDIKKEGSGNAGTTNAIRVLGLKAGILTMIIDIGKGVIAVCLANWMCGPRAAEFAFIAVIIGHVFPVIYGFKGGKGIAAAFGALLALDWRCALILLAIALLGLILTKKMSVGSITAAILFPLVVYFIYPAEKMRGFLPIAIIMAIIVVFNHRSNIMRLIRGEEHLINKTVAKKTDPVEVANNASSNDSQTVSIEEAADTIETAESNETKETEKTVE